MAVAVGLTYRQLASELGFRLPDTEGGVRFSRGDRAAHSDGAEHMRAIAPQLPEQAAEVFLTLARREETPKAAIYNAGLIFSWLVRDSYESKTAERIQQFAEALANLSPETVAALPGVPPGVAEPSIRAVLSEAFVRTIDQLRNQDASIEPELQQIYDDLGTHRPRGVRWTGESGMMMSDANVQVLTARAGQLAATLSPRRPGLGIIAAHNGHIAVAHWVPLNVDWVVPMDHEWPNPDLRAINRESAVIVVRDAADTPAESANFLQASDNTSRVMARENAEAPERLVVEVLPLASAVDPTGATWRAANFVRLFGTVGVHPGALAPPYAHAVLNDLWVRDDQAIRLTLGTSQLARELKTDSHSPLAVVDLAKGTQGEEEPSIETPEQIAEQARRRAANIERDLVGSPEDLPQYISVVSENLPPVVRGICDGLSERQAMAWLHSLPIMPDGVPIDLADRVHRAAIIRLEHQSLTALAAMPEAQPDFRDRHKQRLSELNTTYGHVAPKVEPSTKNLRAEVRLAEAMRALSEPPTIDSHESRLLYLGKSATGIYNGSFSRVWKARSEEAEFAADSPLPVIVVARGGKSSDFGSLDHAAVEFLSGTTADVVECGFSEAPYYRPGDGPGLSYRAGVDAQLAEALERVRDIFPGRPIVVVPGNDQQASNAVGRIARADPQITASYPASLREALTVTESDAIREQDWANRWKWPQRASAILELLPMIMSASRHASSAQSQLPSGPARETRPLRARPS